MSKVDESKHCSPAVNAKDGSCFNFNTLISLIKIYNEKNPKNPILFEKNAIEKIKTNPKEYKLHLLEKLEERLNDECDNQRCWIVHSVFRNRDGKINDNILKLRHQVFKPERPKGKEWLSNFDIGAVLDQYEKKYPSFYGFVYNYHNFIHHGYDFPDFKELEKSGKTKLGYVYNTGAHWIAIYIDLAAGYVYNFDSMGSRPTGDIPALIEKAKKYIIKKGIEPDVRINTVEYQRGNDECGVFSILFIIKLAEGMNYDNYIKWLVSVKGNHEDDGINKMRDYFFTTYSKKK